MFKITEFIEGSFYLSTGSGKRWSDYDGPFETIQEAVQYMALLCGDLASPEMINSTVVTHFSNNVLDLVKDDNGVPIDGKQICWKNTICKDGEIIWESNDE